MRHPATYLNMEQAAALAGMSRQAFSYHVEAGSVVPEITSGRVKLFRPSTINQWVRKRAKNGTAKRGPQAAARKDKRAVK